MWRILTTLFLFCLISGCTQSEIPDRDTLTVALSAGPATLDPRRATDAAGERLTSLLFNSLVKRAPDLKIVGDAAESWTYRDLTYAFRLRKGLTFANGRPLDAADIKYSFQQFMKPESPFQSTLAPIKKVEVLEDHGVFVVQLHLSRFHAPLLSDLTTIKLLPQKETEAAGPDFGRSPIGTGSFTLKSQDSLKIEMEARASHPVETPKIKRLIFKIIQDDATRYLKVRKGAIDIAEQELPPNKIADFENNKNFRVIKSPGLSMNYVLLNLRDGHLKILKLRQAMSLAINREEIIEYKLNGLAQPATTILTPAHPDFEKDLKPPVYDLAAAKDLVKDLDLQGVKFTLKTSNTPAAVENGRIIANQLEKLGFKVTLQSYEWSTFYGDVKAGNFEIALMRWVGTTDPDINRLAFHSSELPPGRNRGAYINKDLDQMLEQGPTIVDPDRRRALYKKIQTIVLEDLPIIPLWYDTQIAVIHSRVKDFVAPINGDYSGLLKAWK